MPADIHPKKGYWVKVKEHLLVPGEPLIPAIIITGTRPIDTTVSLNQGWNLVGVVAPDASQPWQPIPPNPPCEAIWEYLPPYHVPDPNCEEGRGFWIKASEDTTIWP